MKLLSPLKATRSNKRQILDFCERYGFVYFGYVNQHDDEHAILRGMTVSNNHHDDHYAVGSYEGYDVAFVERSDNLSKNKSRHRHTWHIMQFDLHTSRDLPHIFIGLHTHSESFYQHMFTKYTQLRSIALGSLYPHSPEFAANYRVYSSSSRHMEVERLFDATIDAVFVKNFGSLAVEIVDGSLYVYSEHMTLNQQLLEAMLKNGVWLATHLDTVAKSLD